LLEITNGDAAGSLVPVEDSLVFGRIRPALGLMMCLSTFYYAWLAYKLAQKTGRSDVCALPSGVSVPHMFIVTFVIMLPIATATGDPIQGWEAGLVWVFFQSFILMIGGFIASFIISQIIAIGGYYSNSELSYVLAFTLFIVLMFVRPRGLFAR